MIAEIVLQPVILLIGILVCAICDFAISGQYVSDYYRVLVDYLCGVFSVEGKNTGCYRSNVTSGDSLHVAHKYHAVSYAFRTCYRCLGYFVGVSLAGGCVCVLCV